MAMRRGSPCRESIFRKVKRTLSILRIYVHIIMSNVGNSRGGGGGDLVSTLPGCVCRKVKDMGPFSASSE